MSGETVTPAAKASARPPGAPALRHRDVLAIAIPIILANVTTPLIGIVDTAVLGQLGDPFYIGAVAFGGVIFSLVYWAFGFLRMGTTGLTAQARGAGDESEVAASLARALLIAAAGGLALIALQQPISLASFGLVEGSEAVETGAKAYFDIRIWGAPAALANYALFGWFIGRGEARPRC
jgi:MATE family multidrug resistance protein